MTILKWLKILTTFNDSSLAPMILKTHVNIMNIKEWTVGQFFISSIQQLST